MAPKTPIFKESSSQASLRKRLQAYSLSALALTACVHSTNDIQAQVISRDLDPDAYLHNNGDTLHLDFDGDGTLDIRFEVRSFFSITYYYSNYSFHAEAQPLHTGLQFGIVSSNYPKAYGALETIGPTGSFSDGPFVPLYDYTDVSGPWHSVIDAFLGFRLLEPDGWHYGWVRLKVNYYSSTVRSYGYNLTADEEVTAGLYQVPPSSINTIITSVEDLGINNPVNDIDVEFIRAIDESTVNEYRAMIVPADSSSSFAVSTAELVPASAYVSFSPGGGSPDTVNLGSTTTDALGSAFEYYRDYVVYILSMADGVNATVNTLSEASEIFSQELIAGPMGLVSVSDVGNTNLGEDVHFDFFPALYESAVAEYRLFYSLDSWPLSSFPLDDLLATPPSLYKSLSITDPKSGELNGLDHYIEGNKIELGRPLYLAVIAVGIAEQGSSFNYKRHILSNENWMVNDLAYNLPANATSFGEVTLSFQPAAADSSISEYRVSLSTTTSSPYWTPYSAAQQPADSYIVATADGSGGFTADLATLTKNSQGYPIYHAQAHTLTVLSVGDTIGNELTYSSEVVYIASLVVPEVSASVDYLPTGDIIKAVFTDGPFATTNRVMVVKNEDVGDFDVEAARLVPNLYSINMLSGWTATEFNLGDLDVSGNPIVADQDYRVFVLSLLSGGSNHPEPSYLSEPSNLVRIESATGIEENVGDDLVFGMADGILSYSVESTPGATLKAEIVDIAGRLVWSSQGRLQRSGQVDVRHLPSGIYHFRIFKGEQIVSRKFAR